MIGARQGKLEKEDEVIKAALVESPSKWGFSASTLGSPINLRTFSTSFLMSGLTFGRDEKEIEW